MQFATRARGEAAKPRLEFCSQRPSTLITLPVNSPIDGPTPLLVPSCASVINAYEQWGRHGSMNYIKYYMYLWFWCWLTLLHITPLNAGLKNAITRQ